MKDLFIETYSGKRFHLFDQEFQPISGKDIMHALSNICRFGGHTREFYSVAQHSVLVSQKVPAGMELYALLHDASEAYLGDVVRPLKHSGSMEFYLDIEEQIQQKVYAHFGLVPLIPAYIADKISEIDQRVLFTEKRDVLRSAVDWGYSITPYPEVIKPVSPQEAKRQFLERLYEIANQMKNTQSINQNRQTNETEI